MINQEKIYKNIGLSGLLLSYVCGVVFIFCIIFSSSNYEYTFNLFKFSYAICPFDLSLFGVVTGLCLIPFNEWD